MAKNVSDEVRERNQPEPSGPEPTGGLIQRTEPNRLAKIMADPLTDSATLQAERERLEATAAAVKQVEAEKLREEKAKAKHEAEQKRGLDRAGADADAARDAIVAQVRAAFPGWETLAARLDAIDAAHRKRVAELGAGEWVAERRRWAHEVERLRPLLEMLRHDDPPQGQRDG